MAVKSRQFGIFLKIRLAFFQKGLASLLCFVKEVIKHGGITCKFLYSCLSVKFGV